MDSLTTLIGKIQAQLGDTGTRFSTATCTAAIRSALDDYNEAAPVHAGTLVEVVASQLEYDLSDEPDCANLVNLLSVHKQAVTGERDTPLVYDFSFEDNRPFVRLRNPESSGFLIVRFTIPNTVNGLDSETESTVESYFDQTLVDGGCMHACRIRAGSLAEAIKLDQTAITHYNRLEQLYKLSFDAGLKMAAKRQAPRGEPDTRSWKLDTHGDY